MSNKETILALTRQFFSVNSYESYIELKTKIVKNADEMSNVLQSLTVGKTGAMGLISEELRLSPEYRIALNNYNNAFKLERVFNGHKDFKVFQKQYNKELMSNRIKR